MRMIIPVHQNVRVSTNGRGEVGVERDIQSKVVISKKNNNK